MVLIFHDRQAEVDGIAVILADKSVVFPLVYVLAFTGCRRNEGLALRWGDLDTMRKTLRIERAWEQTKTHGLRLKPPKKEAHKRTINDRR